MTVDRTDPEIFEDDTDTSEAQDGGDLGEVSLEAPEADAAEQLADLTPSEEFVPPERIPNDADEADLAEQARIVDLDEDDYR
ncbi:hypothetical protein [Streptomyces sulfonofaciens]|nr:hypothetical protein [Streptomyces sulfonofaciens]